MFAIIHLLATFIADLFKSPRRLEVENLFLRHQLNVALRRAPQRVRLRAGDRALMVWMTRRWPSLLGLSRIVQPDTILRWHRCGFRAYWRWKSRGRPGRPRVSRELRELIQRMSKENPLWGAPRIHGEVLKLGFEIAESTVSTYMIRRRGPPSQTWRTFLRNHAHAIAAIDLCVVPTLTFERLPMSAIRQRVIRSATAVDASVMEADASRYHGKAPGEIDWSAPERQTRAVAEFLTAVDDEDADADRKPPKVVSPVDPCSAWTAKANKRVQFGYGLKPDRHQVRGHRRRRSNTNGLTSNEIAGLLGPTAKNISSRLSKLAAYGIIGKVRPSRGPRASIYRALPYEKAAAWPAPSG